MTMIQNLDTELGTATSIVRAVSQRNVQAKEIVIETFERIASIDGRLNAFCALNKDGALLAAETIDKSIARGEKVGPLAGVPVAIKDLLSTMDIITTYGSLLYKNFIPKEDDIVVERLRTAGAIIIGKTNTSEFGYGAIGHNAIFPATRNPWNLNLTPGGSSAGSAAAVAANIVPVGMGSDGGGSVRIPAALCGVFGIKPSLGRIPVYPGCRDANFPGISSWESLEHIGPICRSVDDAALILSAVTGPSPRDRFSLPNEITNWQIPSAETLRGSRIALSLDLGFATVDREVANAVSSAARKLENALGCTVDLAEPRLTNMASTLETLVALDTDRAGLLTMAEDKGIVLGGWLGRLLARQWTADEFSAALMERKQIVNTTSRFMDEFDFLITPTTASTAFDIDIEGPSEIDGCDVDLHAWVAFSALGNFTGYPTASVPIGLTKNKLPIGLQIMGRHLDDLNVLCLSSVVQHLHPMPAPLCSV